MKRKENKGRRLRRKMEKEGVKRGREKTHGKERERLWVYGEEQ